MGSSMAPRANSHRLLLAAVGMLAAVLVGVGLWRSSVAPPPASAPRAPTPSAPHEPSAAPELAAPVERTAQPAPAEPAAPREPQVVLIGVVSGPDGPQANANVIVAPAYNLPPSRGFEVEALELGPQQDWVRNYTNGRTFRTDARGEFRADINAWFASTRAAPPRAADQRAALWVKLLRDGADPVEFELRVPLGAFITDRQADVEYRAQLRFAGRCQVRGRVVAEHVDEDAPELQVAAFALVDGAPQKRPQAQVSCRAGSGEFEFELPCNFSGVLVLWADGFRPRTLELRSGSQDVGEHTLERGATIRGRASIAGEPVSGLVRAQPQPAGALDCSLGDVWVTWDGGQFEWTVASDFSAEDGTFELRGLRPGAYAVSLGALRRGYASELPAVELTAPASGVEFAPECARVELLVSRAGAPLANASFEVAETAAGARRIGGTRTDAEGRAVLYLDPKCETIVVFQAPADSQNSVAPPIEQRIATPPAGQSRVLRIDV